jgi:hypothetical protein
MAKIGEDWLFIGLGIGAVYLIISNMKPLGQIVQDTADAVSPWLENIKTIGELPKNIAAYVTGNTKEQIVARVSTPENTLSFLDSKPNPWKNAQTKGQATTVELRSVKNQGILNDIKVAKVMPSGVANSTALNYVLGKNNSPITTKSDVLSKSTIKSIVFK